MARWSPRGIIALIWAAAGCSLYEVTGGLNTGLAAALANGQSAAIYDVCLKTMGGIGTALAMLGVIACPITSGDTAFRSARLVLADWLKLDQKSMKNRLILCIPVLGVGASSASAMPSARSTTPLSGVTSAGPTRPSL